MFSVENLELVSQMLKKAKEYHLECKVVLAALIAVKNNPTISILEATTIDCNEWDIDSPDPVPPVVFLNDTTMTQEEIDKEHSHTCNHDGNGEPTTLPFKVPHSNAGFYIGTWCDKYGPYGRESGYYATENEAQKALDTSNFYRL